MSTRFRVSAGILAAAIAVAAYSAIDIAGQQPTPRPAATGTTAKPQPAAPTNTAKPVASTYKAPRTPDGQPDLQGFWTNATLTPLERPTGSRRSSCRRRTSKSGWRSGPPPMRSRRSRAPSADVHYDFTQFALDKTQSKIALNYRTSQIVDPPDGKIPRIAAAAGGGRGGGRAAGAAGAAGGGGGGTAAAIGGGARAEVAAVVAVSTTACRTCRSARAASSWAARVRRFRTPATTPTIRSSSRRTR